MFFIKLSLTSVAQVPSGAQNFVMEVTVRDSGVRTMSQLAVLPVQSANRTIQYFDGLGRALQSVDWQGSPLKKDIVQHIAYDAYGREGNKYLPYTHAEATGAYKTGGSGSVVTFYNKSTGSDISGIARTPNPYAVTVFESSPLNRVKEQGAPGAAWQPLASPGAGHTVKTAYGTNTNNGADTVTQWEITPTGAEYTKVYAAGKLYRTTVRDENSVSTTGRAGSVDEYKDFEGRVILKRIWNIDPQTQQEYPLNTQYVYDDFGNLRYVIPPGYRLKTKVILDEADFNEFIYAYKYDDMHRATHKKIPGRGWDYIVYDRFDRPIMTQDAVQRSKTIKEWSYIKYDGWGRVIQSGIMTATYVDQAAAQVAANTHANSTKKYFETRTVVVATVGAQQYTGYTNLSFPISGLQPRLFNYYDDYLFEDFNTAGLVANGVTTSGKTKTLLTASKVYKVDGALPLLTINYYDSKARLIQTASQNHLNGKDYVTNSYSFSGELLTSTRVHTPKTGAATTIVTTNQYDHVGRLIAAKEKIGAQAEVILATNSYNEIGQLKARYMGRAGTEITYVDSTTYSYNERGWTKRIASTNFTQSLMYEDGGLVRQWNGNIAQQSWRFGVYPSVTSTFEYSYDKLNRLLSGTSTPAGVSSMAETITYDDMGNIKTFKRDAGAVTTYAYTGNRLTRLTGGISGTYIYDDNGNTKIDREGMAFTYNYLNLPQTAIKVGTNVSYLYDALGKKLRKTTKIGTNTVVTTTRDYVDGIEYNGANIEIIHNGVGYALKNGANYVYHYNLTDHLGNVRATLKRGGTATTVDVVQRDNYYPYGMRKVVAGGNNKYLYNGKEIQGELGDQYDYGARFYDPIIGRWNVVDPLAFKYFSFSPYNYAANNPIRFIDPDGRDIIGVTKDDAKKALEDIRSMFKDDKFSGFRDLLSLDKKGKTFNKIGAEALSVSFDGVELSVDEQALVDIVSNTINSDSKHFIEYVSNGDNLSSFGSKAINESVGGTFAKIIETNGGLPSSIVAALGGAGVTTPIKAGTYSLLIEGASSSASGNDYLNTATGQYGGNPVGRPATVGHELFGHGRSLSLGRSTTQHIDAIRTENLILRMMGKGGFQRDGTNHAQGTKISLPSSLPDFR